MAEVSTLAPSTRGGPDGRQPSMLVHSMVLQLDAKPCPSYWVHALKASFAAAAGLA
ncbi:hypothetical protein ABZU25_28155 [Micromonospora sp. NPDC005215]|uniref:hypothetical protein n=1 Tax=Micromonospora sp. NPDC005215 TaxID=3157024 RepID=UPI0033A0EA09